MIKKYWNRLNHGAKFQVYQFLALLIIVLGYMIMLWVQNKI